MNDNKKFWQRFAKLYSPFMERGNKQLYEQICEKASPFLSKEMTVLELACGSGQLSFRLSSKAKAWKATGYGYEIQEQDVLGSTLTPLCCLIAARTKGN